MILVIIAHSFCFCFVQQAQGTLVGAVVAQERQAHAIVQVGWLQPM
jgi:hypothetical protein